MMTHRFNRAIRFLLQALTVLSVLLLGVPPDEYHYSAGICYCRSKATHRLDSLLWGGGSKQRATSILMKTINMVRRE